MSVSASIIRARLASMHIGRRRSNGGGEHGRRFPGTGNLLRRQAYLADVELATLKLNSGS